jgi:VWFA-related protein
VNQRPLLPCALLLGLAGVGLAQTPTFRAQIDVVRVDVLATDRGRPIRGLTAANFELRDNGVAQRIDAIWGATLPIDVMLVLDASDSVRGLVLEHLKRAALALTESLGAKDRVQLWTFSHRVSLAVAPTSDQDAVRRSVDRMEAGGATALLDAIYTAFTSRAPGPNRSIALLFSDGKDNRSWLTETEVIDAARNSETVVYAVASRPLGLVGPVDNPVSGTGPDEDLLAAITNGSGGRLLWTTNEQQLRQRFLDVLEELRSRYVLSYTLGGSPTPGWHAIKVRLKNRTGEVRARAGYTVAPDAPRQREGSRP